MFTASARSLILYQIVAHLALILMLFLGSLSEWTVSVLIYILFSTVGGTVTYHRLLSHKSFSAPKWFEYFGSILGAIGGNGSGIAWAAIHREHHRFVDREGDPHDPKKYGFFNVQFLSMLHTPKLRYVPDLLRSKFHIFVHEKYWLINLVYIAAIMLIDPWAIVYAYFVPTLMVWHGGSAINTLNHLVGYRNFETKDHSTNNFITGFLVGGEGWHNNHHAYPADPQFGKKWWELDLGWYVINLVKQQK